MSRLARIAIPNLPYHVTQRGNRRQPVFFQEADYRTYLQLLREQSLRWGLQVWAYCLMTNHVHLLVVPSSEQSLARGVGETHRRYTRAINFREGWRGYLWQGRFASVPLDEAHLLAAFRYIEQNPVAAGLAAHAEDYPWSSARAHVRRVDDPVLSAHPLQETLDDWRTFLRTAEDQTTIHRLEEQLRTGRPQGADAFVQHLEETLGRPIRKRRPGPQLAGVRSCVPEHVSRNMCPRNTGSVVAATDTRGVLVETYRYRAFGEGDGNGQQRWGREDGQIGN